MSLHRLLCLWQGSDANCASSGSLQRLFSSVRRVIEKSFPRRRSSAIWTRVRIFLTIVGDVLLMKETVGRDVNVGNKSAQ